MESATSDTADEFWGAGRSCLSSLMRGDPFDGPDGKAGLLDMFEGQRQLLVWHFMFDPSWDEGCPSCSLILHARDSTLVAISRAPIEKLVAYKRRMGWTIPW